FTLLPIIIRLKCGIMRNTNIESRIIHAVWSSVSAINKQMLTQLDDRDLIQRIMREIDQSSTLTSEDRQNLLGYISSKVLLIRDIAGS
ncbi:MAG: hypothetical protein AAGK10_08820, partial [Cyanobacteria bacterium J06555_3]